MIRVTVPRPVAEALMDGSLRLLVVEGEPECSLGYECDDTTHDGRCGEPRPDPAIARAIEAGERIGIETECQTSVHLRPGRECIDNPNCTDGRVRVGSVRPVRVLPVRTCTDHIEHICVHPHWMPPAVLHHLPLLEPDESGRTEHALTDALYVYGPAESLIGRYAVVCEDARRGE